MRGLGQCQLPTNAPEYIAFSCQQMPKYQLPHLPCLGMPGLGQFLLPANVSLPPNIPRCSDMLELLEDQLRELADVNVEEIMHEVTRQASLPPRQQTPSKADGGEIRSAGQQTPSKAVGQ